MVTDVLGDAVIAWAQRDASVDGLILIGSRVRAPGPGAADQYSDWDFHIITSNPDRFRTAAWTRDSGIPAPLAYVARGGRLGSATKVSAVFAAGQLDLVVIPTRQVRQMRWLWRLGLATRLPAAAKGLADLAVVIRAGYRVLKGDRLCGDVYARVAKDIPTPRLSDEGVRELAEGFVCDYVSTRQKIARGELIAAQRWLHHLLVETNFRLLHELRLRRGEASMPDARRVEQLAPLEQADLVRVAAVPDAESLTDACEQAADALRALARDLIGDSWHWPPV
ncbi:MAG TPA: hypothetical protein VHE61_15960 [Opitutaceae bacterium]|nr:hypothetical protein [Opitutaceae bacterium]